MADVLHSALTGSDLHECKGAAAASLGQVPVANGSGSAPFSSLSYTYLSDRPPVPQVSYSGSVITGTPLVKHYLVTASSGIWTQALTGFSAIHSVQAQATGSATTDGTTFWVTSITSVSTTSISGQVRNLSGSVGTSQQVYLTVFGV